MNIDTLSAYARNLRFSLAYKGTTKTNRKPGLVAQTKRVTADQFAVRTFRGHLPAIASDEFHPFLKPCRFSLPFIQVRDRVKTCKVYITASQVSCAVRAYGGK
jgi:hypothetical protein